MAEEDEEALLPMSGVADESSSTARDVISKTIQSVHADIVAKLNFGLIYPHLNQAGIIPHDSIPDFMCPMVPDHTGAQINNLIMWLHQCSLEQFSAFISLVKATEDGGDAHKQLSEVLEKNFEKFRSDSGISFTTKSAILKRVGNRVDGPLVMQAFGRGRGFCSRKWKDWNCKFWCAVHTVCWSALLISSLFLFMFVSYYPSLEASGVTPKHVVGSNILVVDTGDSNFGWPWAAALRVGIKDCPGTVHVLHHTNCSVMTEARIEDPNLRNWPTSDLRLFLEGSYISINYTAGYHNFAVVKSYAAHQAYLDLCNNLGDKKNGASACLHAEILPYLCADNSTASPLLTDNTWCFKDKYFVTFPINESDFYFLIFSNGDYNPIIRGVDYIYESSILQTYVDRVEYNITPSMGVSYATLPITSGFLSFDTWNSCVVIQSRCTGSDSEVDYLFGRRHDILLLPSLFVILCGIVVAILVVCHIGHVRRRRNQQIERES